MRVRVDASRADQGMDCLTYNYSQRSSVGTRERMFDTDEPIIDQTTAVGA